MNLKIDNQALLELQAEGRNISRVDMTDPAKPRSVPQPCQACGQPASYGRQIRVQDSRFILGGPILWWCSTDWQRTSFWKTRQ